MPEAAVEGTGMTKRETIERERESFLGYLRHGYMHRVSDYGSATTIAAPSSQLNFKSASLLMISSRSFSSCSQAITPAIPCNHGRQERASGGRAGVR